MDVGTGLEPVSQISEDCDLPIRPPGNESMAALVGIEPTTIRLTGDCSSTELQDNDSPPGQYRTDDLLIFSQALLPN